MLFSFLFKINKALANREQSPFVDQVLTPKLKRPPVDATSRLHLLKVIVIYSFSFGLKCI